jgi:hypothetical protein
LVAHRSLYPRGLGRSAEGPVPGSARGFRLLLAACYPSLRASIPNRQAAATPLKQRYGRPRVGAGERVSLLLPARGAGDAARQLRVCKQGARHRTSRRTTLRRTHRRRAHARAAHPPTAHARVVVAPLPPWPWPHAPTAATRRPHPRRHARRAHARTTPAGPRAHAPARRRHPGWSHAGRRHHAGRAHAGRGPHPRRAHPTCGSRTSVSGARAKAREGSRANRAARARRKGPGGLARWPPG